MKSKDLFPGIFSRHARAYQQRLDGIMARREALGRERVIELVDAQPGMRILDLACGPGNLSRRLAAGVSPGGDLVGVDLAPGMIELARQAGIPSARFEVMDIEHLAFDDGSFDAAACGHGLQFVPDLGLALSEARRVLRGHARFAASVPFSAKFSTIGRGASPPMALLDSVVDRWVPPAPRPIDQTSTRETVQDADRFRQAALDGGFGSARVESIDEAVHWESAEQLVGMFMSWWDCASRLEGIDADRRQAITDEAIEVLRHEYPGEIETTGRNHVLFAKV